MEVHLADDKFSTNLQEGYDGYVVYQARIDASELTPVSKVQFVKAQGPTPTNLQRRQKIIATSVYYSN